MTFNKTAYYREKRAEVYATRPDAQCACGCARLLPKKPQGKKWFSPECRNASRNARRRAERANGRVEHRPLTQYIWEAKADTASGLCPWCDEPLPSGRKVNCGDQECTRAYQRAYRTARCEASRAGRPLQAILCKCGCGNILQQDCLQRKYIDKRHYANHRNRLLREARAANPKPRGRPKGAKKAAFMRPFGKKTEPKVLRPFYN